MVDQIKLKWLVSRLRQEFGLDLGVAQTDENEYRVVGYSPTEVELGYVKFQFNGPYGDQLFETVHGMFACCGAQRVIWEIRREFVDCFHGHELTEGEDAWEWEIDPVYPFGYKRDAHPALQ
jgi:hypothetical protein